MPVLYLSLIVAVVFFLGACLAGLVARLRGRRRFLPILKNAALAYFIFLPCFLFLILPLLFSYLIAHASTRPQDQAPNSTPAEYHKPYGDVEFSTSDGLTLRGWYLEGNPSKPAVILCHGLFRDRREMLERSIRLHTENYSALLFDFRSHGESERAPISLGYNERLDVLAACEFVLRKQGKEQLILFGVSMGAVATIHVAPELTGPFLSAIVADSPFLSLDETVTHHTRLFLRLPSFPFADVFVWNLTRMAGYEKNRLNTIDALQKLPATPVLLIYGAEDARMPVSLAEEIYQSIPHDRKKMILIEDAGHAQGYRVKPKEYMEGVLTSLSCLGL